MKLLILQVVVTSNTSVYTVLTPTTTIKMRSSDQAEIFHAIYLSRGCSVLLNQGQGRLSTRLHPLSVADQQDQGCLNDVCVIK